MKIGIVGMGLIGGSLAKATIAYTANEAYGFDTDEKTLQIADNEGAYTRRIEESDYSSLDIVVFALRPDAAIAEMKKICPRLKDGAIVTDICGVKRDIVREMQALKVAYPSLCFISTHPMAGKERGGIVNSDKDLFKDAFIVVVNVNGGQEQCDIITNLYLSIGARGTEYCSAEKHDEMIAYTSQLAHAVSSCYVQNPLSEKHAGYSAGSFADLTRVARLDPDMWTELFLENSDMLGSCLDDIIDRLCVMRNSLKEGRADEINSMLKDGVAKKSAADSAAREWK